MVLNGDGDDGEALRAIVVHDAQAYKHVAGAWRPGNNGWQHNATWISRYEPVAAPRS